MKNTLKNVVLVSGGIDSLVTFASLIGHGEVHPLFIHVGARASDTELRYARRQVAYYRVKHRHDEVYPLEVVTVDIPFWRDHLMCSPHRFVIDRGLQAEPDENGHIIKGQVLAFRNFIMLSIGASYCASVRATMLSVGFDYCKKSTSSLDKCPEFVAAFQKALDTGGEPYDPVKIYTPLQGMDKPRIIKYGMELGAPFELSFSCYNGYRKQCGFCRRCTIRRQLFADTKYGKDPAGFISADAARKYTGGEYDEVLARCNAARSTR